jgi:hypothetical protein
MTPPCDVIAYVLTEGVTQRGQVAYVLRVAAVLVSAAPFAHVVEALRAHSPPRLSRSCTISTRHDPMQPPPVAVVDQAAAPRPHMGGDHRPLVSSAPPLQGVVERGLSSGLSPQTPSSAAATRRR